MSKENIFVRAMSVRLLCVVVIFLSMDICLQKVPDTKPIPIPRCRSLYTSTVPRSCVGRCHTSRTSVSPPSSGEIPVSPRSAKGTSLSSPDTKEIKSYRDNKEASLISRANEEISPSLNDKETSPSSHDNNETSQSLFRDTSSKDHVGLTNDAKEESVQRVDAKYRYLGSLNTSAVPFARFRKPTYQCSWISSPAETPLIPTRASQGVFRRTSSLSKGEDPSPPAWRRCQQTFHEQEVASLPCYCDGMCPLFGDCCPDYYKACLRVDVSQLASLEKVWASTTTETGIDNRVAELFSRMGCLQFLVPNVYYRVVNKCDRGIRNDQLANRRFCEGPTFPENITSIPLRLLANERVVFKNAYCAFCNGFRLDELDLKCPAVFPECSAAVNVASQDDLRRGFADDVCWLTFNDSARSVMRACLPPSSLVQSACGESEIGGGNGSNKTSASKRGSKQAEVQVEGQYQSHSQGHFRGRFQTSARKGQDHFQDHPPGHSESRSSCLHGRGSCQGFREPEESKINPLTNWSRFPYHSSHEVAQRLYERNVFSDRSSEGSPQGLSTSAPGSANDYGEASCLLGAAAASATSNSTKQSKLWSLSLRHHTLTSSCCLCGLYRHPVGAVSGNGCGGRLFFANLDCLACSVGKARPQIHVADRACEDRGVTVGVATKKYWLMRETRHKKFERFEQVGGSYGTLPSSFRVFFQLTENGWGYQVGGHVISPQLVTCSDDKVYVPYYSDCVPMHCGPHAYPHRGRCLLKERLVADPVLQPFPNGTTHFSMTVTLRPMPPVSIADQNDFDQAVLDLEKDCVTYLARDGYNISGTDFQYSRGSCMNTNAKGFVSLNSSDCAVSLVMKIETLKSSGDQLVVLSRGVVNTALQRLAHQGLPFDVQTVVISNMRNMPSGWQCLHNDTVTRRLNKSPLVLEVDDDRAYFLQMASTTFFRLENIGFELQTFNANTMNNATSPELLSAVICDITPLELSGCRTRGYIHLNASAFSATNDSLVVSLSGETLNTSQFVVFDNGSAIICSVYNSTHTEWVARFAMLKDYMLEDALSLASMSLSMASLVTLLAVYSLLPELRNVPGVIVMSYAGSLLASQVLISLAGCPPRGWLCELHSCLIHISLLSSFLWKSVLSFDLVFMLRLNSVKHSSRAVRARMLNCYAALSWMMPAASVAGFWLLDHFEVYEVGYGSHAYGVCWLNSREPNLYLIMVPLAATWIFNIICFALALRVIHRSTTRLGLPCPGRTTSTPTTHGSAEYQSRSTAKRAAEWRRLKAYARISLLMGVTWVLCFLAAAFDVDELWMAHVVINGAQGVYLLICFVLKRRVLAMLKTRFMRREEGEEENGEVWRKRLARAAAASGEVMDCQTNVTFTSFTTLSEDSPPRGRSATSLSSLEGHCSYRYN